jgi:hypothetical protein
MVKKNLNQFNKFKGIKKLNIISLEILTLKNNISKSKKLKAFIKILHYQDNKYLIHLKILLIEYQI